MEPSWIFLLAVLVMQTSTSSSSPSPDETDGGVLYTESPRPPSSTVYNDADDASKTASACDGNVTGTVCSLDCRAIIFCPDDVVSWNCLLQDRYCYHDTTAPICSPAPRCMGAPIICAQEGVFPDPYFCSIYHTCTSSSYSQVFVCSDAAYNIATGECNLPLGDAVCADMPVPVKCVNLTQAGALVGNPNFYYRCRLENFTFIFCPAMLQCPDGFVFDEEVDGCQIESPSH